MEDYILVDIGNTHYHIWKNGKIIHLKEPIALDGKIYFISVNEQKTSKFLALNKSAINLASFINLNSSYKGLGADRAVICKAVDDGVVVDAGSAITIDVMQNKKHLGGVIMPGLYSFKKAFEDISPRLRFEFENFSRLPNSTAQALSYGSIGAVCCVVNSLKDDKKVYLTGGDGKFLSRFIDGEYIEDLMFKGMKKIIKEIQ
ncbi:MAG: type III pantothenate kinase [Epsilonproteobacteria bacterium]|nr:type III pantothenate kinase [Campylobacterota bacterium]